MTDPHADTHHSPTPAPEEDKLPYGKLALISVLSLFVFFIGGLWATWILYKPTGSLIPGLFDVKETQLGKPEIGIVDQRLFEFERRSPQENEAGRKRLSTYGWVDRANNKVHIPIERAMQQVAEGRR